MSRTERLLALLQMLRNRRLAVTAATLAQELDVSPRTIYRDMRVLLARGAVVQGEAGVGYVLRGDHFLPPLMLDAAEASALFAGLEFVIHSGGPSMARAAEGARGKIDAVLPATVRHASLPAIAAQPGLRAWPGGDAPANADRLPHVHAAGSARR